MIMRGTILIFEPRVVEPSVVTLNRAPLLDELRNAVHGDLEAVPYFNSIAYGGVVFDCVAFCNEHGKLNGAEHNIAATLLWQRSQARARVDVRDMLVGPVVVLFGDREFRESL